MSNGQDHAQPYHLDSNHDADDALRKIRTTGSLSISPELFEKIYLSPQNKVAGELRKTVGNPTPIALVGFLLSLSPLSCDLMNWRGAQTGDGAAGIGFYIGYGGILMILGGLGEWLLGNTFPATVFLSFGAFWIGYTLTLTPYDGAFSDYGKLGLKDPHFNAAFGFILIFMGVLCLVYLIIALRTNLIFVLIFACLVPAFGCLAGTFFHAAQGETVTETLVVAGGLAFVVSMLGWYLFFAILLAAVDFPFSLPVVDLSHMIKGASDKAAAKGEA